MDLNKLKQEAEEWLNKWELCNKCENKVDCISNFSYCKNVVLQSYLAGAEPREKRIAELDRNVTYYAERAKHAELQSRDIVIRNKELEKENAELKERVKQQSDRITELTQELDDYINRFE